VDFDKDHVLTNLRNGLLQGADLSGIDLRWSDLREAKLAEVKLTDANLSGANLTQADLAQADLARANLQNAVMSNIDLCGAYLYGTQLVDANLQAARLINAKLISADLFRADLSEADLTSSNLTWARFFRTRLWKADLSWATCGSTSFIDVDLSQANGLETVRHEYPSYLDIGTLYFYAQNNSPETFLRGCGLPEDFITYARSLTTNSIQFYSCFISYSSKDEAFVRRLHADLQSRGVRCYYAPEDMKIGDRIRSSIDRAIRIRDKLLLVLSENSINSSWVEKEVETAFEEEKRRGRPVLFPIRLDDAVMDMDIEASWAADIRRARHIGDFRDWTDHDSYFAALERLLRDLKASDT